MLRMMTAAAALSVVLAGTAAQATSTPVTSIRITNALPSWLQVSEVIATQTGTGTDVALASQGANATASSNYGGGDSPAYAIDGVGPTSYPYIYHSAGNDGSDWLLITLAHGFDLSGLTIEGRDRLLRIARPLQLPAVQRHDPGRLGRARRTQRSAFGERELRSRRRRGARAGKLGADARRLRPGRRRDAQPPYQDGGQLRLSLSRTGMKRRRTPGCGGVLRFGRQRSTARFRSREGRLPKGKNKKTPDSNLMICAAQQPRAFAPVRP